MNEPYQVSVQPPTLRKRKAYSVQPIIHEQLAKEDGGKQCTLCLEYLTVNSFANSKFYSKGKFYYCRACCRVRREERKDNIAMKNSRLYWRTREKHLAQAVEYNRSHPEKRLLQFARSRARKLGVPFNLVAEDIVIPEFCPALGIRLVPNLGVGGRALPESPNLDRIIPALGYVRGNVQVISHKANMWKANRPWDEWQRFAQWILTLKYPDLVPAA